MGNNNKLIHLKVDLDDDEQKIQKYIEYHGNVWPEVIEDLKERGIDRMRIFISGNRLNVISYGKERPVNSGSNPLAWSQNRRSVTVKAE